MEHYNAEGVEDKNKACFVDTDCLTRDFQSEVTHNQQGNLPSLMAVTSHSFGKLFNSLVKQVLALEGAHSQEVMTAWAAARKLLILQQKHLFLARTRDKGLVVTDEELQLINEIPEYAVEEENRKAECPESAIRMIAGFSGKVEAGSGATQDLLCEEWIQSGFAIFRVQNLTQECLKTVMFRKLLGDARLLITTYLSALDITIYQLSLKSFISILESQYMAALLSPVACLKQLHATGRIRSGRYLEGVGHICRLAKLSCRQEVDPSRKKFLTESRSVETFRNALGPKDQALLNTENTKRTEAGHDHMTALKSARFLQAAHLARQGTEPDIGSASETVNQVEQAVFEEVNYIGRQQGANKEKPGEYEARRAQRGRPNFQTQTGGQFQRGGFPKRDTFNPRGNPRGRGTNFQRGTNFRKPEGQGQAQRQGFTPRQGFTQGQNRGFTQNRGQRGFTNQGRGFLNQAGRGRNQPQQNGRGGTQFPTAADLGIAAGQCFLCGSTSHRWHQPGGQKDEVNKECPYEGLHRGAPRLTKCGKHNPPRLGHAPAVCLGNLTVRQVQEQAQIEEDYAIESLFGGELEGYE